MRGEPQNPQYVKQICKLGKLGCHSGALRLAKSEGKIAAPAT